MGQIFSVFVLIVGVSSLALASNKVSVANIKASPAPQVQGVTIKASPTTTPKPTITQTAPKTTQITCTGPDHKEFQTSETECIKFRTGWGLPASPTSFQPPIQKQNTKSNNTTPNTYVSTVYPSYPPCTIYYPALNYTETYEYMSPEYCELSKKTLATSTPQATVAPIPIIDYVTPCIDAVRKKHNELIRYCQNEFGGGSSAGQACTDITNNDTNDAIKYCNSL